MNPFLGQFFKYNADFSFLSPEKIDNDMHKQILERDSFDLVGIEFQTNQTPCNAIWFSPHPCQTLAPAT